MARLTMSPIVAGISGTAADGVYASWKGRQYVRKYVKPANPNSSGQQTVRESMGRLPRLWRSLPAVLRATQDRYAVAQAVSGWNWFVKQNRVAEQTPTTGAVTPPSSTVDKPTSFTLASGGAGQLDFTWGGSSEGAAIWANCLVRKVDTGTPASSALDFDASQQSWNSVLASVHAINLTSLPTGTYTGILIITDAGVSPEDHAEAVYANQAVA